MMYKYGMRLRGYSIGCQPKDGLLFVRDDPDYRYHNILFYNRKLTDQEVSDYELDYLGEVEQPRTDQEQRKPSVYKGFSDFVRGVLGVRGTFNSLYILKIIIISK